MNRIAAQMNFNNRYQYSNDETLAGSENAADLVYKTKLAEIWIDQERILQFRSVTPGEIDLEEAHWYIKIYEELGCHKQKVLQLMRVTDGHSMSKEAREYIAKNGKKFFIASAIINGSLPIRMMVNFFNRFYKHGVPFRLFANEEDALKWLREFKK